MIGRVPIAKTDDLDILSGIWIMSCNDDTPIMTYRSIAQRLNLTDTYDVRAIVRSRPELFRPGILSSRLNAWKDLMRAGKSRPAWIAEIHDPIEQRRAIDGLSRDDVFRNQFRVEDGAPKCDVKLVDWGLQHIDRLRKAASEEREARSRKWNSIIIPTGSLIIALASVIGTVGAQLHSSSEQEATKRYAIEFGPKQRGYATFMDEMMSAAYFANAKDDDKTFDHLNRMEIAFYAFEPFLDKAAGAETFKNYKKFAELCAQLAGADHASQDYKDMITKIASIKTDFRVRLFSDLFEPK